MRKKKESSKSIPKVGDLLQCVDDLDVGIVISLDPNGPYEDYPGEDRLYVEVEWAHAGRCTDGWCPISFSNGRPLYEIVSRV